MSRTDRIAVVALSLIVPVFLCRAEPTPLPAADGILRQMVERLPQHPIVVVGRLVSEQSDKPNESIGIELRLRMENNKAISTYTVADSFGTPAGRITIEGSPGRVAATAYAAGPALTAAPAPDLNHAIPMAPITWMDLCLGFLWWTNGATIGRQEVRGQACLVVDLHNPSPARDRYGVVRVWIEERSSMLLQAEAYDHTGELARRVIIKSIKKIGEEWMIKDLEIRRFPDNKRTMFRVDTAAPAPAPN